MVVYYGLLGFDGNDPLVMTNIAVENHHYDGKIHYKWLFSIAML